MGGTSSGTKHYSPLVGADIEIARRGSVEAPLEGGFEHAVIVLDGDCALEGRTLDPRALYHLGTGRSALDLSSREGARVLLLGGQPFHETVLMWWNFVAYTKAEIAQAREDWELGDRFGEIPNYDGPRMEAPPLTHVAPAEPVS